MIGEIDEPLTFCRVSLRKDNCCRVLVVHLTLFQYQRPLFWGLGAIDLSAKFLGGCCSL